MNPRAKSCFVIPILAACFLVWVPAAAEVPGLKRLEELGATVKQSGGVLIDLRIDCTDLTDADYKLIGGLTTLKSISISGKPMMDRHLALLSGLSQLETFQINGTQLTDDGYRHFAAFEKLRRLSLFHPSRDVKEFTGKGLAHLKPLANLRRLTFAGATAGDEAFKAVGKLTQLEEFSQWHNWESPDAIKQLVDLRLKKLKMGQRLPSRSSERLVSLNDNTLDTIAKMKSLESVDLQEARLTYTGLQQLKKLKHLTTVKLKWVDVSDADIAKLRHELSDVSIEWEPLSDQDEQSLLVKKLKL
ncbi:hypothetical protein [Planctomycetes bacterium K23_9]|uniref:Leucine Rich repeats (2 copies) n=1 Tax=Stieleria marina TaxID=1930275 RepID=A0A517NWQ4_9BACT|nr:Leucine Rich repeats (2 copies) [Planctomycetes bacterium K23_9]